MEERPPSTPDPGLKTQALSCELSIIIPAYNEEKYLPACLGAIRRALIEAGIEAEIIVADDDSTDGTTAVAIAHGSRVAHSGCRQIAGTRNAGARAARGRFLVFVDADTEINGPLLSETLEILARGKACGGGAICKLDTGRIDARLAMIFWSALSRIARWAAGSYLFCLRDAFEAVGGFDARLYASEEIDFSRRAARWGKPRGLPFVILTRDPYLSSARRTRLYTRAELIRPLWRIFRSPRAAVRNREACGIWYDGRR